MASYYGSVFDNALRKLRHEYPLPSAVVVRTCKPSVYKALTVKKHVDTESVGFAECDGSLRSIYIIRGLNIENAVDTLVHEWAHLCDWLENGFGREDHRDSFGKWYSRCYRVIHNGV